MENILKKIDRLRMERAWTEYQLAKNSGIPQSTISTWFRKQTVPTIESLNKICNGLGITLSEFFYEGQETVILTPEAKEMLDRWSALSPKQREIVAELVAHMGKEER